jgi:ABC-type branched-subunit amino acid transport system ATPase component/predicted MFS family arabinose efflux permease
MAEDARGLTAQVLEDEAERAGRQASPATTVLPDDLLPGVGGEDMPLREALRRGGRSTVITIGLAGALTGFDNVTLAVLSPDIQATLGASDAVMGAIAGAGGVLFLLGSVPISSLADRLPRVRIAAVCVALWSVMILLTGLVQNAFSLFLARLGGGLAQSYELPVNGPVLVDAYPIEARARVFGLSFSFQLGGFIVAPLLAGGIVEVIGGGEAWRWAFFLIAVLSVPLALALARLPEPRRGRHEMQAVLGEELDDRDELPISLSVAFERLRTIKSFHFFLLGMASLGLALFSLPIFVNLFLEDELGLDALERGLFSSVTYLPAVVAITIAGTNADRLFRRSPPGAVMLMGGLVGGFGIFVALALLMPSVWLVGAFLAVGTALARAAFTVVFATTAAVMPYRLRSRGVAMVGVYLFCFGGFFGAVLTGLLADAIGRQAAVIAVTLPSSLIGGALMAYGARYVRGDISRCVEELQEEQEELARRRGDDGEPPVVQVRNLDFAYGTVQVLFDVAMDVHRGETVALLGTNGAGKSTLLRVVSGLGVPRRGVVRLNGRTVTYADPEVRVKIGIVQLMGGKATFPSLSVRENLRMAGYLYRGEDLERRVDGAIERFPALTDRIGTPAGDLSGGQQQMLALAMALVHEPEVLVIDELSLGLAPVVVQELLGTVRDLKARGQTMIIVEQSLNIAQAVADRALFLEKGEVRFDGPIVDLVERDDLARAVFLGGTTP